MIDMNDYNRRSRSYWFCVVGSGSVALAYSIGTLIDAGANVALQVGIGAAIVGLTALFPVRVPGAKTSIAASELFVFLTLLLFGPAAATVAAAVEGAVGSFRTSRRWTSRLGTPAINAVSMLATSELFAAGLSLADQHSRSSLLLPTLLAFSALYAFTSSHLFNTLFALKRNERLTLADSARNSIWQIAAYVASAALSAMMFLSFQTFGWAVIFVGVPVIGMFLSTIHFYFRHRTISHEAALAAQHLEAMKASESRFHSAFTHAAIGMALVSTSGTLVQVNDSLCTMLDRPACDLDGRDLMTLVHPEDFGALLTQIHHLVHDASGPVQFEIRLLKENGEVVRCSLNLAFFSELISGERSLICQIQDVTARRTAEAQLHYVAYHDALTALPNRAHFNVHLVEAIARSQGPEAHEFAAMYLDFDRFKVINDSLGHRAGDRFLTVVAARLQTCLRENDVIARLGGDEFAILLADVREPFTVLDTAKRLLAAIAVPVQLGQTEVTTSASIGITFSSMGYTDAEDILRDADIAMYKAKANGKAQYAVFDNTLLEHVSAQLKLESELRRAMIEDQLVVYYQPLFALQTTRLCGFEALVRWNHPEHGLVDPGRFIPIAEEAGLIVALGEIVFEKACIQLNALNSAADEAAGAPVLMMNINVSGVQLACPNFVRFIADTTARLQVDPKQINIEVTESVLMNAEGVIPVMQQLADMGIKLSIDDFGTGYSSLSYLHRLPFDTLKIDRSFVERMNDDGNGEEIVRSIVALGRALGKSLVAEGIENAAQLAKLRALGCDEGQGYHFSRPVPAEAISALLDVWRAVADRAPKGPVRPALAAPATAIAYHPAPALHSHRTAAGSRVRRKPGTAMRAVTRSQVDFCASEVMPGG